MIEEKDSFDPMLRSQQMLNKFEASDEQLRNSVEVEPAVAKSGSSGEDSDSNIIVV